MPRRMATRTSSARSAASEPKPPKAKRRHKSPRCELDARARFEVAGGEADGGAARFEMIERLVHGGLDVIEAGGDLGFEVAHVDVEDGAHLLVGGRAIVMVAEDAVEDERIGHAVEAQVLERAEDAHVIVAGALEGAAARAVAADERAVDVEEVQHASRRRATPDRAAAR